MTYSALSSRHSWPILHTPTENLTELRKFVPFWLLLETIDQSWPRLLVLLTNLAYFCKYSLLILPATVGTLDQSHHFHRQTWQIPPTPTESLVIPTHFHIEPLSCRYYCRYYFAPSRNIFMVTALCKTFMNAVCSTGFTSDSTFLLLLVIVGCQLQRTPLTQSGIRARIANCADRYSK